MFWGRFVTPEHQWDRVPIETPDNWEIWVREWPESVIKRVTSSRTDHGLESGSLGRDVNGLDCGVSVSFGACYSPLVGRVGADGTITGLMNVPL